jgi:hypothetical protein
LAFPSIGMVELSDSESNRSYFIRTKHEKKRLAISEDLRESVDELNRLHRQIRLGIVDLRTDTDPFPVLLSYFKRRR